MATAKLFMVLLGCRPAGRLTEQHDVFFGIAPSLKELVPAIKQAWPGAGGGLHIDAWREVNFADGCRITIVPRSTANTDAHTGSLFFINLGGYQPQEFEEFHYKLVLVAATPEAAVQKAKQHVFYKHTGFKGAAAHVDDKYGLDVDEVFKLDDLLTPECKARYALELTAAEGKEDSIHLGYLPLWKIKD